VALLGSVLPWLATSAWAHPSGLPQLRARADLVIDDAANWLIWDFHPSILTGVLVLGLLYGMAVGPWRRRYGWSATPAPREQVGLFYGNLVLLYFTLDGPLHHLADELLFSAHMLQHMLLQLLWAPLLVVTVPEWLWRAIVRPAPIQVLARWATRPLVAFLLFNGVVFGWHVPPAYNLALTVHGFHILQHLMFMSTAVVMWFVMMAPLAELRVGHGRRMTFIFVNMLAMKVLGILISLSDNVLYTFYLSQPRAWGVDAMADQQLGGLLMWLPGGSVLWVGLGRVFWQWVRAGTPARGLTGIAHIDQARAAARVRADLALAAAEPANVPAARAG